MRSLCKTACQEFSCTLLSFLFVITAIHPTYSQTSLDNFSPGSLVTGLGRSGVVENYDPIALYWNPAALAVRHYSQGVIAVHEPHHLNYLAYSRFTPTLGTFGVSYSSTSTKTNAVQLGSLGWGYRLASGFYGGISAGHAQHGDFSWGTLGVGLLYRPTDKILQPQNSTLLSSLISDRLTLGIAIQNLPLGKSEYDHQIRLGASYKFLNTGPTLIYAHHFMPNADSDHLGLLITPVSSVQIYAGFKNFDSNAFSFGAGFQWENMNVQVAYDRTSKRLLLTTAFRIGRHPRQVAAAYYNRALAAVKNQDKRAAMKLCHYSLMYDKSFSKSAELQRLLTPIIARENDKIDSLLHAAITFQNQGSYLDAAAQYLKILKIDPQNSEAVEAIAMIRPKVNIDAERWYMQAVDYYEKGDINRAEEIFESIILVKPDHFGSKNYLKKIDAYNLKQAEQHYFAGLGYYSQHKLDLADAEFRKALDIAPNYEDASTYLSRIAKARAQNRIHIEELRQQAEDKEQQGAWKSALALYEEILNIQPDHARALSKMAEIKKRIEASANRYFSRGLAAYNSGELARAERNFRSALSVQPSHSSARRYLQKIVSSTTDKAASFVERAQQSFEQGDWQGAIAIADSALEINPKAEKAAQIKSESLKRIEAEKLLASARDHYTSGQYLEAMEELDQALKTGPENPAAQALLHDCQQKLYDRVDDYFSRGIELYTEERYQEAIRMWDIVLRINPYHKGALDYQKRAQERIQALESLP